jgi:hypothetical protein
MKNKKLLVLALACCTSVAFSGCYTVLQNPNALASLHDDEWSAEEEYSARADRYDEYDEAEVDDGFYRYPGVPGSYGAYGGAGYPLSGYGSSNGYGGSYGYGNYGYGGSGYGASRNPYGAYADYGSYGYGPYSYGYDPYYTDSRGSYVPPGYELVNTRELDDIRASLAGVQGGAKTVDKEAIRAQQRRKEAVWSQRVAPQMRKAPTPQSRSSVRSVSSPPSSSSSSSSSKPSSYSPSSPPASKTTSTKASTKPTKKRR